MKEDGDDEEEEADEDVEEGDEEALREGSAVTKAVEMTQALRQLRAAELPQLKAQAERLAAAAGIAPPSEEELTEALRGCNAPSLGEVGSGHSMLEEGLDRGADALRQRFALRIRYQTERAGHAGGRGAVLLGYVVNGQVTLTRMEEDSAGDAAHIVQDLAGLVGEAARMTEAQLPRRAGPGGGAAVVDYAGVVEEAATICHDSEAITDLRDEVKGDGGRKKKARPSKDMRKASAGMVCGAMRRAGAVLEAGGVYTIVGRIAYDHAEEEGLIGDRAQLLDDDGHPLPTTAWRSEELESFVGDVTGLPYSAGLRGASPWTVIALVPPGRRVGGIVNRESTRVVVLRVLVLNHMTWAIHRLFHGDTRGNTLGYEALDRSVRTQYWQVAQAMGGLCAGMEMRPMESSPFYRNLQPLTLRDLGECRGWLGLDETGCWSTTCHRGRHTQSIEADRPT